MLVAGAIPAWQVSPLRPVLKISSPTLPSPSGGTGMPEFVPVAKVSEIADGSGKTVVASGKEIAVFNVGGKFHAIENACLHRGGPLGDGTLEGTVVTCPWHGWQWDVTTGANAMGMPQKVGCFQVKVEGGQVFVAL
jgi:nitrite reductase/ring-hydroxylating ferredoxin subunit